MVERFPTEAELSKRRLLIELLDSGMVTVQLDPRRDGVDVPTPHKSSAALTLNLSHAFNLDTFDVGAFAIRANLSFGGVRHLCVLPYNAIYAIVSQAEGKHLLFPDDVPVELTAEYGTTPKETETETAAADEQSSFADDPGIKKDDGRVKQPHLRLLK